MFAQNFPSFSSGSSTPFANQDCWSCRESSDQLCAPPRVFPICIFYCRVSNSFSKHLLSPCWSQEHYTRHLYIKMNHSCLCFQELAVKWRRWCVFKWAHKVKRDKTKQNKTLSIIAARGGENFREVMATNRIKSCGNIQKYKAYEEPAGFGAQNWCESNSTRTARAEISRSREQQWEPSSKM